MAKQLTLWDRYKMPLSVTGFFITALLAYTIMTSLNQSQEIRSNAAYNKVKKMSLESSRERGNL